jgi:hypothetical protein
MCNPYNHNPFATTPARRDLRSEYDANRELAKEKADREEANDIDPWNEWGLKG